MTQRMRAVQTPITKVLSRSEMAFAGIHEKEMPHLRNYARYSFPDAFWFEDDPIAKQKMLWPLLEAYVKGLEKGSPGRTEPLRKGIEYAKSQWQRALRKLEARQVRRLPRLPDPMKTGATPTVDHEEGDDDLPAPRSAQAAARTLKERTKLGKINEHERIKAAHAGEKETDGHERWDPKWGDPGELEGAPGPLPQGMKRLPQSEVVITPNPRREQMRAQQVQKQQHQQGARKKG